MATFSKVRKAPLKAGTYKAIIHDIREYQRALIYELSIFDGEKIVEASIHVFTNGKDYDNFQYKVANNYFPDDPEGEITTESQIGTVVKATISVYTNKKHDQYLRLDTYGPYTES